MVFLTFKKMSYLCHFMLDNRLKYRHLLLLVSLLVFGSCQTVHKLFQKERRGETVTVASEELDAYNDSVNQEVIKRFRDSCAMVRKAESDSLLRQLPPAPSWKIVADSIIDYAMEYIGTPYKPGGNGPDKFDCSGFTSFVFRRFGYRLTRTVVGQLKDGWTVIEDPADLRRGDLVFYGARKNPKRLGHVGIVVNNDPDGNRFTFIHATVKLGVTVSASTEKYYRIRYLTACRILPE